MSYVGERIPSARNARLVAGAGQFTDDIVPPGLVHLAILRSPYAHARIRSIDTARARAVPGVLDVLTGEEIVEATDPIVEAIDPEAMGAKKVRWYALCHDRVRFVGEAVAAVVAEDRYVANEALELIDVDYEELAIVADRDRAMQPDSPLVEPQWGDNLLASRSIVLGDPERAFADAAHVVTGTVTSARISGTPLEPRGVIAAYDPYQKFLTAWISTQAPHPLRFYLAQSLRLPEGQVRVVQPDVGGGFGLKMPGAQEDTLVCYASLKLRRPVKWIESRAEHLTVSGHSRDTRFEYEAAYEPDGQITAIRLRVVADIGAPSAYNGWGMTFVTWYCLPGPYKIPNGATDLHTIVTNKGPWNAYRGYGKDAAAIVMDRIVDEVAKAASLDTTAVRFRNFIPKDEFPYPQISGAVLDSGDYAAVLQKLLAMVDYDDFPRLREEARKEGRHIGLGIGQELTPEGCSMPGALALCGYDSTEVRVTPAGDVMVLTGVTSPGSGNETGIAQMVADTLGCELSRVRVIQGDTESCPWGSGNYSSRSVILGGSAGILAAQEIRDKMFTIAGRMLEASAADLDAAEGRIFVRGSREQSVTIAEVATQAYQFENSAPMDGLDAGLEATRSFKIPNVYHQPEKQGRYSTYPSWPNAAAACVVEVDPETGYVRILRHVLVHDAGKIINPLLADAQLHGGIAQGLGAALYEGIQYDEDCQLLTTTFMDYTIPTAVELPRFELGHHETLSPFTPLGTKGVGESGLGCTTGALISAVENALPHLDLHLDELPLTPERVWTAIQRATPKGRH